METELSSPPRASRARIAAVEGEDLIEAIDPDEEDKAKDAELARLHEFGIYEPVDDETAWYCKKLSTKWHTVRKPGGSVRARFVAREFRSMEVQKDWFAASGTAVTAKLVDVIAAKKQ